MSATDDAGGEPQFQYILHCPCGESLRADGEDEIVDISFAHLREKHPDMANDYEREHILFMALKLRK
jgi:predicted small metal-binding protein